MSDDDLTEEERAKRKLLAAWIRDQRWGNVAFYVFFGALIALPIIVKAC